MSEAEIYTLTGDSGIPTVDSLSTMPIEPTLDFLTPQQRKIYESMSLSNRLLRPYDISQMTNIPPKSVSARLSELGKMNIITRLKGGYYSLRNNPSSGNPPTGWEPVSGVSGGGVLPRVQNIRLVADAVVGVGDRVVLDSGVCCVSVEFGVKRGLVSAVLSADLGFDPVAFSLAVERVGEVCADRGYPGLDWRVSSFEWLNDFYALRSDPNCITLRDFQGVFTKVYMKPWGVRRESRWSGGEVALNGMWELMRGDVQQFNYGAEVSRLAGEVEAFKVAQKYANRELGEIRRLLEARP